MTPGRKVSGEARTIKNLDEALELARSLHRIARAITPDDAMPGHDATGRTVASLTEAVMGITAGLSHVAEAIGRVADTLERARVHALVNPTGPPRNSR
jgi:hypothetical protein